MNARRLLELAWIILGLLFIAGLFAGIVYLAAVTGIRM